MPNQLSNLDVSFVSLVDRAAVRDPSHPDQPMRFLLTKSEQVPVFKRDINDPTQGGDAMPETVIKTAEQERDEAQALLAKAQEDLAAATSERDDAIAKAAAFGGKKAPPFKADSKQDDDDEDDVSKADLPAAVRARLEKADAEIVALRKQADEAAAIAKAERDRRVTSEFVAKADADFRCVGGNPDEFGPILKRASETLDKADYDALEQRLRAANAQIETSAIFKAMGANGDGDARIGVDGEVTRKAQELRKNDSSLSLVEAKARVFAENPDLAARHLQNVR